MDSYKVNDRVRLDVISRLHKRKIRKVENEINSTDINDFRIKFDGGNRINVLKYNKTNDIYHSYFDIVITHAVFSNDLMMVRREKININGEDTIIESCYVIEKKSFNEENILKIIVSFMDD